MGVVKESKEILACDTTVDETWKKLKIPDAPAG